MGKLLHFPQARVREDRVTVNAIRSASPSQSVSDSQRFMTLFTEYLRRERGASENTVSSYLHDVDQFQFWLELSGKTLPQAQRQDLQEYLATKMAEGLSPRSVGRKLSTLRTFYRLLLDEEYIRTNPTKGVPIPKTAKPLPHFLELSELEKMVQRTEQQKDPLAIRDKAILLTLFASGLRGSEMVNLKLADLNLEAGTVKVWNAKAGKMASLL